jgi:ribosomal-protein-alanine N-acetyltransferase
MNIRAALESDSVVLAAIDAQHPFSAHWSAPQIQSEITHPAGHVLVSQAGGKITGFIVFRAAGGAGEIVNLAVHHAFLRRGVGALLVQQALLDMRALQTTQVTLEVHEDNQPAQGLYRKAGFEVLGRRKKFYNDADALIMGINL